MASSHGNEICARPAVERFLADRLQQGLLACRCIEGKRDPLLPAASALRPVPRRGLRPAAAGAAVAAPEERAARFAEGPVRGAHFQPGLSGPPAASELHGGPCAPRGRRQVLLRGRQRGAEVRGVPAEGAGSVRGPRAERRGGPQPRRHRVRRHRAPPAVEARAHCGALHRGPHRAAELLLRAERPLRGELVQVALALEQLAVDLQGAAPQRRDPDAPEVHVVVVALRGIVEGHGSFAVLRPEAQRYLAVLQEDGPAVPLHQHLDIL
mmetsp:Transcript_114906/g.287128  ORF Transcript_114906/g.287128 Transcript_114906/m.287128 type:complete len:267 (-) Transcript_114906:353-1153(-)